MTTITQTDLYNELFNNYSIDNTTRVIKKVCTQFTDEDCQTIFGELVVNIFVSLLDRWKNYNNPILFNTFKENQKNLNFSVIFNIEPTQIGNIKHLMLLLQDHSWGPFVYSNLAWNVVELIDNHKNNDKGLKGGRGKGLKGGRGKGLKGGRGKGLKGGRGIQKKNYN